MSSKSKYKGLRSDDDGDNDDNNAEEDRTRRLSLQITDLPVTHYFARNWDCFGCCKKSESYRPMLDDEESSSLKTGRSSSRSPSKKSKKDTKAQETLMAEQCLDATVNKIVNNLSWVNATLLAVAMKNTLHISFPNADSDHEAANNAWIYFFVIFIIGIILAVAPRAFEDLDEMKRELDLKSIQKFCEYILAHYIIYNYIYFGFYLYTEK